MAIDSNIRGRNWNLVLYPDDPSHLDAMGRLNKGYNFVAILHDKDVWGVDESSDHAEGEAKKDHWHIIVKFPQARWGGAIAKELGIDPRHMELCRSFSASVLYLTHFGLPTKYQYDASEIFGPLTKIALKEFETDADQNARVLSLLELLDSLELINEIDLIRASCDAGLYGDLIRMGGLIPRLVQLHNIEFQKKDTKRIADAFEPFWPE